MRPGPTRLPGSPHWPDTPAGVSGGEAGTLLPLSPRFLGHVPLQAGKQDQGCLIHPMLGPWGLGTCPGLLAMPQEGLVGSASPWKAPSSVYLWWAAGHR